MPITTVCYCTREMVQVALDVASTARSATQIDRVIATATQNAESSLRRLFYPVVATRKFDWPPIQYPGAYPWRMWLDENELISATTVTSGGVVIPPAGYLLEPVNAGPPYDHIDINLGTQYAFNSAATWQQSLTILGVYGYNLDTSPGGTLAANITTTSATIADVSDGSGIGVGNLLAVGSERMLVTNRSMIVSGLSTAGPDLAADSAVTTVQTTGSTLLPGEVLLVDAERMLVVDAAGNNLVVKRSWDGTVLAAHTTGTAIYVSRRLTVTRGAFGTTAATHNAGDAVSVHQPPPSAQTLALAEAMNTLLNEEAGYRTAGANDNTRTMAATALKDARAQALSAVGRKARSWAI